MFSLFESKFIYKIYMLSTHLILYSPALLHIFFLTSDFIKYTIQPNGFSVLLFSFTF